MCLSVNSTIFLSFSSKISNRIFLLDLVECRIILIVEIYWIFFFFDIWTNFRHQIFVSKMCFALFIPKRKSFKSVRVVYDRAIISFQSTFLFGACDFKLLQFSLLHHEKWIRLSFFFIDGNLFCIISYPFPAPHPSYLCCLIVFVWLCCMCR